MGLTNATGGGNWIDLDPLAREKTLVVFRVRELLADRPSKTIRNRINKPVLADLLICTGPQAGEVHRDQDLIGGGVVGTLRRAGAGADVAARLEVISSDGNPYVGAQTCTPEELEIISKVYDDGRGFERATRLQNSTPAAQETASAGAGGSTPPF